MSGKILLTGGLGFIGHNLALKLRSAGLVPVVLDNYSQKIANPWHERIVAERVDLLRKADIQIITGDTLNPTELRKTILEVQPARIAHLAAIPSVVLSNRDPGTAIEHNFVATKNMLEIIREEKIPLEQFVFFSSSTVYGDFKTESVDEDSPTTPKGIYEAAKLSSEIIIKAYHNLVGIPFTIVRPSALYGPRCINNRVTQIFIERALMGLPLQIEGDGSESLDFTYIMDLVEGLYLCLSRKEALNQTFNLTCGRAEKIVTLTEILRRILGDVKVEFVARDRMKPRRGKLEIGRAQTLLGYCPQYALDRGYPEYIDWYLRSDFRMLMSGATAKT